MNAIEWQPCNYGANKMKWFVFRPTSGQEPAEYLYGYKGKLRRFASRKAAQKVADKLNKGDQSG